MSHPNHSHNNRETSPQISTVHANGRNFITLRSWLNFRPGYSLRMWTLYTIVMIVMSVARLPYILPNRLERGYLKEELYNFKASLDRFLLRIHLASVLPAGLMTALQFVPGIRARSISYHRTAGKIINVLSIVSAISACSVARISFGGELSVQSSLYALGLMTAWSVIASWRAIRQLHIDQHRAWTIRAWSYQVSVITLRLVMPLLMNVIFASGGFYTTMGCDEVANSLNNATMFIHDYPQCQPGWTGKSVTQVSVLAGRYDQLGIAAAARTTFGTSMWISLCIHLIGTEYYLYKSKDESDRLHRVSNKLQNIRRNKASEETVVTDYHLE